jgi:hypothetical protein
MVGHTGAIRVTQLVTASSWEISDAPRRFEANGEAIAVAPATESRACMIHTPTHTVALRHFISLWPAKFPSRRLGASSLYCDSDSGLADRTKEYPAPLPTHVQKCPSARSARFIADRKQTTYTVQYQGNRTKKKRYGGFRLKSRYGDS